MVKFFFRLVSYLIPLFIIQALGSLLGVIFHYFKKKTKAILILNLRLSELYKNETKLNIAIKKNICETGKTILESIIIWVSSKERILRWIYSVDGEAEIIKAQKKNKGIIFLTPHLGCYEITSIYYGATNPITVLYRPSRKSWLADLIVEGRKKGYVKLAQTNSSGVKSILMALKKGEAIGILPDQLATKGEGEWAPFFKRQALTMTLVSRLVKKTGATVIMAYAERISLGRGFIIHLETIEGNDIDTPTKLNFQLEKQIRKSPTQYLWNYDRYKGHESQIGRNI